MPSLQKEKKKLRLYDIKQLAQDHTAIKWQNQDSDQDSLVPKSIHVITTPYSLLHSFKFLLPA